MIRSISFDEWMSLLQQLFGHLLKELQTAKRVHKNIIDLLQAALPQSYFHDNSNIPPPVLSPVDPELENTALESVPQSPQATTDLNTSDIMSEFLELNEHNPDDDQSLSQSGALSLLDLKQPEKTQSPFSPLMARRHFVSESERAPLDMFGATSPPQSGIHRSTMAPADALPDDVVISRSNFQLLVESSENIAAEACAEAQQRLSKLFSARGKDGVDDKLPAQKYHCY